MESAATVGHASLGVGQRRTMSVFVALKDDIAVVTDQDDPSASQRVERGKSEAERREAPSGNLTQSAEKNGSRPSMGEWDRQ